MKFVRTVLAALLSGLGIAGAEQTPPLLRNEQPGNAAPLDARQRAQAKGVLPTVPSSLPVSPVREVPRLPADSAGDSGKPPPSTKP